MAELLTIGDVRAAAEVLALPIYPEVTRAQVDTVVDAIAAFYR